MDKHQEKLSLLQDLIALSKIDNNVPFSETTFINAIASGLGISMEELDRLRGQRIPHVAQEKETDRITQFYRLLLLMSIDNEYHDKELSFCKETGLKMGLNPSAMHEIIHRLMNSQTNTLPPQEIIEIFKVYHN